MNILKISILLSSVAVAADVSGQAACSASMDLALEGKSDITRASTDKSSHTAGVTFEKAACTPRRLTRMGLELTYEDKRPPQKALSITRVFELSAQQQHYLSDVVYLSGNARLLHNTNLGLYLSQQYSLVLGTRLAGESAAIELFGGPAFVGQHFITNKQTGVREESRGYPAGYVGETFAIVIAKLDTTRSVVFNHGASLTIPVESGDPNAMNFRGMAGLDLPLTKAFGFNVRVIDEYLRDAPPGFEKHFFNFLLGISWTIIDR